ncbi:MAG: P1 family peptidase [Candidatus Muiribacteriota bacterium]
MNRKHLKHSQRPTVSESGITIGRFSKGHNNSITDVRGVRVGHVTNIQDNVEDGETGELTRIRTGVTAIVPSDEIYTKRMIAGGFVLNGVGEMLGLTQVMEWGLLETPILLTNSLSVGKVHDGVVSYMIDKYPSLGTKSDVVLPVVGETDDSFLNDVRNGFNYPEHAVEAILKAKSGRIEQGSVGAGTGMITCDFSGGIGTSSRMVMLDEGGFTLGVLVLSNFGKMRNLTIDGMVVGRELDRIYEKEIRRKENYGSIIIVIATDAPLISSQLSRISKRAALGLGRVGSYAGYTSGEIIIAFSTANKIPRHTHQKGKFLTMKFIADNHIDPLYEAVIEATEEAVLNALFCSNGMNGRDGKVSPAIPVETVLNLLEKRR